LQAGIGYGGSCFPKDVKALHNIALNNNYNFKLLKSVIEVNSNQRSLVIKKAESALGSLSGKKICLWGLAFKPNTDDTRESAAIDIIKLFQKEEAVINIYDPQVDCELFIKNNKLRDKVSVYSNKYKALKNCNALVIVTEWEEFKKADLKKIKRLLKNPVIIDGRNIYDPEKMRKIGFDYAGFGRKK
jgi:UDPglucose 6-dehydrogenase